MVLILGYGNPLRGDDALGHVAADHLSRHFKDDTAVQVRTVHQLTPELAQEFAAYMTVILIDAGHARPPGQVFVEEVRSQTHISSQPFSHYVPPSELLQLVNLLYDAAPKMFLTGITAATFDMGAPLSAPVRDALPSLYNQVVALVETVT